MNEKYNPQAVEQAAQAHWQAIRAYEVRANDPRFPNGKFYACSMLPYPSGKLHMGHVRNYTLNDVMARQLRMKGYNVLMPMGWDAFGLPAENAALKNGVAPAKWTYENIAYMKKQCQAMGWAIDWTREFATCDPEYYKWNQWLFLKMLEKGVVYKKTQVVNWDPVDQTVLANEQVIDGRGWRSGAPVERREIPGYYMAITDYADELLDCVKNQLTGWPTSVRTMQENWIGKSVGVRFAFRHDIRGADGQPINGGKLFVFTTRADTIMGVTFCAVAPEHPLAQAAAARDAKVAAFIDEAKRGSVMEAELATAEKQGVPTGLAVTHPLTGEQVPLWVGNYVLMSYGDGAVMGVPAHDERDFAFAKKYGLPIKPVIDLGQPYSADAWQPYYADYGRCIDSGPMDGMSYEQAVDYVAERTAADGGRKKTQFRLRDWSISRQRYWGTPIPVIHCGDCGDVPVPYEDLPVVLPADLIPDGSGNPLARCDSFLRVNCPRCGKPARRETDTMDTFVDSAWYYMRYTMPQAEQRANRTMISAENRYWMPMDQYIGGITHAVLHLLYARFWTKVMRDMGMVDFGEPFTNLLCQGMVLNHIYFRKGDKGGIEYFAPDDVEAVTDAAGKPTGYRLKRDGTPVEYGGVGTMSKSKLNGVDPQEMIDTYGADAARLFVMFASPPEQTIEWSAAGVEGAQRFLRRVWAFAHAQRDAVAAGAAGATGAASAAVRKLRREVHLILKQASFDYERMQYNTVVSACMKLLNALEDAKLARGPAEDAAVREGLSILLRMLYPVAPHICCELWRQLGFGAISAELIDAPWPQVDEAALQQDEIELVLQINGKHRGSVTVPAQADRAAVEAAALAHDAFTKLGTAAKKVVVVPGRLVNIVA
jgi:leucyl-tRNA synthetase